MLSYRHAFHAGNHADVLKHTVELLLLDYLNQKDKPYWYIDTHAGAGCYRLDEGYASKNAEFNTGIGPLWQRDDLPEPLARYVELVRGLNPDGELRFYPGSPFVAARAIRRDDKLRLFELHPTDGNILTENFSDAGRRAQVTLADGFAGLKSVLPPPPRRALVLIDPPFENADEFDIDRKLKPSFTFGFGPHMCIGQYLAKMELSIAINAVLDLFPNIRLDPDRPAPVIAGSMLRGASSVPVIWD